MIRIGILLLLFYSASLFASQAAFVVAPTCLISQSNFSATHLAEKDGFVLLRTDADGIQTLIALKDTKKKNCGGFLNVTEEYLTAKNKLSVLTDAIHHQAPFKKNAAYKIQHPDTVNRLINQIEPQTQWQSLANLTNFNDRYANSNNGVKAAEWIKDQIESIAQANHRSDVSVTLISTGEYYKQPSVVVKIGTSNLPGVIIGAHMDTVRPKVTGRYPGADDDGSGSVTILEAARVILFSHEQFKKPLYFIWYAAEEEGLVGSKFVVSDFKAKNIPVEAVIHFDLTGFSHEGDSSLWIIDDNVNAALSQYLETLITTYVKQPVKHTACGYACSDHATWTQSGFPAAMPAESAYEDTNPAIHTSHDDMSNLSLAHMTDYTKLAIAFAVELAEPISNE